MERSQCNVTKKEKKFDQFQTLLPLVLFAVCTSLFSPSPASHTCTLTHCTLQLDPTAQLEFAGFRFRVTQTLTDVSLVGSFLFPSPSVFYSVSAGLSLLLVYWVYRCSGACVLVSCSLFAFTLQDRPCLSSIYQLLLIKVFLTV